MSNSCSIRINYSAYRASDGSYVTEGSQNITATDVSENTYTNYATNVDFNYHVNSVVLASRTPNPLPFDALLVGTQGWVGAVFIPRDTPNSYRFGVPSYFNDYTPVQGAILRVFTSNDVFDKFNSDHLYYKDSNGYWHECSTNDIVATPSQLQNLPSGVDFDGWLVNNEIIKGDDNKYYDLQGRELFQNLPSGVIPSSTGAHGVFLGSDGNYYDVDGDEILQNLPSDVSVVGGYGDVIKGSDGNYYDFAGDTVLENLPSGVDIIGNVGNLYLGSDGKYYDILGSEKMSNLPSGVQIVSYDSDTGLYEGSDGNHYDIDGNQDSSETCQGTLLNFSPNMRITIDGVDILGNRVTVGADFDLSTTGISLAAGFNFLKKIDRIIVRNLSDGFSVGDYQLKIFGTIFGFRVGFDVEVLDPDFVLGRYNVCTSVFRTCSKYSEVVLNSDMPIGLTPNTSTLDVGYYVLGSELTFEFVKLDDVQFPYCCSTFDSSEKSSGASNDNNSASSDDIVEKLEDINDSLQDLIDTIKSLDLTPHVDVTISPNDLVNIRKVFYHGFDDE